MRQWIIGTGISLRGYIGNAIGTNSRVPRLAGKIVILQCCLQFRGMIMELSLGTPRKGRQGPQPSGCRFGVQETRNLENDVGNCVERRQRWLAIGCKKGRWCKDMLMQNHKLLATPINSKPFSQLCPEFTASCRWAYQYLTGR